MPKIQKAWTSCKRVLVKRAKKRRKENASNKKEVGEAVIDQKDIENYLLSTVTETDPMENSEPG